MPFWAGRPLRDAVSVSERPSVVVCAPVAFRGFWGVCVAVMASRGEVAPNPVWVGGHWPVVLSGAGVRASAGGAAGGLSRASVRPGSG